MSEPAAQFWTQFLHSDYFGWSIFLVAVLGYTAIKGFVSMVNTSNREKTRREIAAYIAEGSMTPEQGEKIMKGGDKA